MAKMLTLKWCLLWLTLHQVCVAVDTSLPSPRLRRYHHRVDSAEAVRVEKRALGRLDQSEKLGPKSPQQHRRVLENISPLAPRSEGIFTASQTVSVSTSIGVDDTVQILPALNAGQTPQTTGLIQTSLETQGQPTSVPILTSLIPGPQSTLSPTGSASAVQPGPSPGMASQNIFEDPIATDAPPSQITPRSDHPIPRLGIASVPPLETNKFYANFFLGNQTFPTYTHPYSVSWSGGQGVTGSWGLAISHIDADQRVNGPNNSVGAVSYYINPVGIQSLVLSAQELGSSTNLSIDSITASSARVILRRSSSGTPDISFPLVQGMGFVTAEYYGATPVIQTGVYFTTVTQATNGSSAPFTNGTSGQVSKYTITLEDGKTWRLYAYSTNGNPLNLQVVNNGMAQATGPFFGIIQIAKDPGDGEAMYDQAAGAYPTTVDLNGSVDGESGTYTFSFNRSGSSDSPLLMFALPHHVETFDDTTKAALQTTQLQTTTKGLATAILADQWTMIEPSMPITMTFSPWSPENGPMNNLSADAKTTIQAIAATELAQDMMAQVNTSSMYYSGKALAKFALICYVTNDMIGDTALAQTGLEELKQAFAVFANNQQQYPLVYDQAWGGVVSSATYITGDTGADFGNTCYNDHHFHYGYHIMAAAVIAYLDPSWLADNQDYVNSLARDISNPSTQDPYFPVSRCFDWYHGHSWAHGLFETADGKDQESSSEDVNHAYALKMWGHVTGDGNLEARGNLMLSIMARSLHHYYLYMANNTAEPDDFIGNKAAGILFENKIDHTTYFGTNIEYIQGIHMLPLIPASIVSRRPDFVQQEWNTYFSNGRALAIQGGWKGIVMGNYASVDPQDVWDFFSTSNFNMSWIDGGASLTWYLAYAAALGEL